MTKGYEREMTCEQDPKIVIILQTKDKLENKRNAKILSGPDCEISNFQNSCMSGRCLQPIGCLGPTRQFGSGIMRSEFRFLRFRITTL
jgi:hypothetical protein